MKKAAQALSVTVLALAGSLVPPAGAARAVAAAEPAAAEAARDLSAQERMAAIDRLFDGGGEEAAREVSAFLRDRDLAVRSHAMKRLVDLGQASVDSLIARLADESVRWLASGALINIGPPAVRKTVLALRHPDPAVRRNAIFILRQIDARGAAPSVREALSDPDPSVQVQAILTVAQFGGEGALRLVQGKAENPVPNVRDAAIGSLPRFGEEAIPALTSLLAYGKPDDVRVAAIVALGKMGTKESILHLTKSLRDSSALARYYACQALGETEDPAVLEVVGNLFDDPDPTVREAASDVFARMPDAGRSLLFRHLTEGNTLRKISAATTVRKARYRPAVPLLLDAMRDPIEDVRVAAVAGLISVADPASVEGLVNGLGDPAIRWLCVLALRQFGDANLRPLLRRTGDPELDYWKQFVLEGMGEKALQGCLDALRRDDDIATKIASLCTLRQIKDTRAVYPVLRLIGDDKLGFVAAFVLSQMGEVAVAPLLLSTQDESPVVRARVATALGEIGLERVVRPLRDLAGDRDPMVRQAAEKALRRVTGTERTICAPSEPCL